MKIGPVYQKFIIHDSQPINDGFCKIFEGINSTLLLGTLGSKASF